MEDHSKQVSTEPSNPLVDSFGRLHTSLRISVTDRCNLRCTYCMPEHSPAFFPKDELLTFEEIERVARLLVQRCGIREIRITGGEPLVRRDLHNLIARLSSIPNLQDLSLTTNGILLTEQAVQLRSAGLQRLNISLDTLSEDTFKRITRRSGLQQTLDGIEAAIRAGFSSIKLNALAIRGITENEIRRLIEFASGNQMVMRFIEYMPLDSDRSWHRNDVLSGDEILQILEDQFGSIQPITKTDLSQPSEDFLVGKHRVGIIRSVTQPFCGQCNRLRITADGAVRNCLFAQDEISFKDQLRGGASDTEILNCVQTSIQKKARAHGINDTSFEPPERPMYAIGG